jgi:hypothetical protein
MTSTVAAALLGVAGAALLFTFVPVVRTMCGFTVSPTQSRRRRLRVSGGSAPPQVRLVVASDGRVPGAELIALSI